MRYLGWIAPIALAALAGFVSAAPAEQYPNRTIRIVVGPSPDVIARAYADIMQAHWGCR